MAVLLCVVGLLEAHALSPQPNGPNWRGNGVGYFVASQLAKKRKVFGRAGLTLMATAAGVQQARSPSSPSSFETEEDEELKRRRRRRERLAERKPYRINKDTKSAVRIGALRMSVTEVLLGVITAMYGAQLYFGDSLTLLLAKRNELIEAGQLYRLATPMLCHGQG